MSYDWLRNRIDDVLSFGNLDDLEHYLRAKLINR